MKSNDEYIIIHEYERTIRSTCNLSFKNHYEIITDNIWFPRSKRLSIWSEYVSFIESSTDNINYIDTIFFILILSLYIHISYLNKTDWLAISRTIKNRRWKNWSSIWQAQILRSRWKMNRIYYVWILYFFDIQNSLRLKFDELKSIFPRAHLRQNAISYI